MKIIIALTSGFVFIGEDVTHPAHTSSRVYLKDASCIRRWGTTQGLGQIALSGPTKDTVLDPVGDMSAPYSSEIFRIECRA